MIGLMVVAHGSPYPEANDDIVKVVDLIRQRHDVDAIELAYLDLNEPDIPTAAERLASQGVASIIVVPYFLHSGKHVLRDIPELLEGAARRFGVSITMGRYIGSATEIVDVMADRIRSAMQP